MLTTKEPTCCSKCGSKEIYFNVQMYVKDKNGKDTKEPLMGEWYCCKCNKLVGRKTSKECNEIF